MSYRIIYHLEDDEEAYDRNVYDSMEEADEEIEDVLSSDSYIGNKRIIGAELESNN